MKIQHVTVIAGELGLKAAQVEATGTLDEVARRRIALSMKSKRKSP